MTQELQGDFILQYIITFLEGIISFISPCMLPLLPLYISYFAGKADKKQHIFLRAGFFVLGFTVVFTSLGLFAGTLSTFLIQYQQMINVICGIIIILFGLSYLEIIHLPFFKGMQGAKEISGIFSAFVFGMIYSVSLTPCVGAFLGSALMLASQQGSVSTGMLMLLCYSLGLGIPFILSAILIDKLKTTFDLIKRNYKVINVICGGLLVIIGIMMATGTLGRLLAMLS